MTPLKLAGEGQGEERRREIPFELEMADRKEMRS